MPVTCLKLYAESKPTQLAQDHTEVGNWAASQLAAPISDPPATGLSFLNDAHNLSVTANKNM